MFGREIVALFLVILFIVGFFWGLFAIKCTSKWPESFKPDYAFFTGCTIETNEGRIPAENYRVL